jgi:hypothetical protein
MKNYTKGLFKVKFFSGRSSYTRLANAAIQRINISLVIDNQLLIK